MASFFTRMLEALGFSRRKLNLIFLGLDNAGKSTIINTLQIHPIPQDEITPTVGFSTATIPPTPRNRSIQYAVFDMSGQGRYRDLWPHYLPDADALVFVLDTTDKLRICVARDELDILLEDPVLQRRKIPILFFANKSDVDGGMTPSECSCALGLDRIKDRNWTICPTNGLTGQGISVGFDWLSDELK